MTDSDQPGPLRVLAAEILLGWNPSNADAIDVLRGLGAAGEPRNRAG